MAKSKYQARVNPGTRLSNVVVEGDVILTRTFQGVSATLAKKLESEEHNGRPKFEVRENEDDDSSEETKSGGGDGDE